MREKILQFAHMLPGTAVDCPFESDFETTVLRHGDTGKWYGILLKAPCRKVGIDRDGETELINLKCDPFLSFGLTESYEAIIPAYHMNKYHWISIILEIGIPDDTLEMLIRASYDLTKKKPRKKS